jgi:hypothetical protein
MPLERRTVVVNKAIRILQKLIPSGIGGGQAVDAVKP